MTPEQKALARHALGLPNVLGLSYRNHYVTGPGSVDYAQWMDLVKSGHAKWRAGSELSGGDPVFWLTRAGAKLVLRGDECLREEDFPEVVN